MNRRTLSTAALGFSLACNLWAVGADLVQAHYGAAGVQSLAVVLVAGCLVYFPKAAALLDTQLATWTAQRDTAQHMLNAIAQHQVEVLVDVHEQKARAH